ncbi:hypothetical protein EMGBS15_04820 [Filimonas sp.]|nr:hypothetical protein EMGBS15_04820 [Filimonas sp.]
MAEEKNEDERSVATPLNRYSVPDPNKKENIFYVFRGDTNHGNAILSQSFRTLGKAEEKNEDERSVATPLHRYSVPDPNKKENIFYVFRGDTNHGNAILSQSFRTLGKVKLKKKMKMNGASQPRFIDVLSLTPIRKKISFMCFVGTRTTAMESFPKVLELWER